MAGKEYYQKNKEQIKANSREYYYKNREAIQKRTQEKT